MGEGGDGFGGGHQEHVVNITGDESGAEVEGLEFLKVNSHDCLVRHYTLGVPALEGRINLVAFPTFTKFWLALT